MELSQPRRMKTRNQKNSPDDDELDDFEDDVIINPTLLSSFKKYNLVIPSKSDTSNFAEDKNSSGIKGRKKAESGSDADDSDNLEVEQ